jgi:hypothetical protein
LEGFNTGRMAAALYVQAWLFATGLVILMQGTASTDPAVGNNQEEPRKRRYFPLSALRAMTFPSGEIDVISRVSVIGRHEG